MKIMNMQDQELGSMLRVTMKAIKEFSGLDPSKHRNAIKRAGEELGHSVAKVINAEDPLDLAAKLSLFWNTNGLGEMELVQTDPLTLEVRNCYDCLGWKTGVGVTLCAFKEGLLKMVFEDVLKTSFEVEETECCGTIAPSCRFKLIRVANPNMLGTTPMS